MVQAEYMIEALKLGEIESGQGLNQEMGLARPGDTRWGVSLQNSYACDAFVSFDQESSF